MCLIPPTYDLWKILFEVLEYFFFSAYIIRQTSIYFKRQGLAILGTTCNPDFLIPSSSIYEADLNIVS